MITVKATIDTAYFAIADPFDGKPDPDQGDCADTTIEISPGPHEPGWDVSCTILRTNIRFDLSASEARKLARAIVEAAEIGIDL